MARSGAERVAKRGGPCKLRGKTSVPTSDGTLAGRLIILERGLPHAHGQIWACAANSAYTFDADDEGLLIGVKDACRWQPPLRNLCHPLPVGFPSVYRLTSIYELGLHVALRFAEPALRFFLHTSSR